MILSGFSEFLRIGKNNLLDLSRFWLIKFLSHFFASISYLICKKCTLGTKVTSRILSGENTATDQVCSHFISRKPVVQLNQEIGHLKMLLKSLSKFPFFSAVQKIAK